MKRRAGMCGRCRERERAPGQGWCADCHNAYKRAKRYHLRLGQTARRRANTRAYTRVLVRRGKLERGACSWCAGAAQAHHPDYGDPRLVVWLCRDCHRQHHAEFHG